MDGKKIFRDLGYYVFNDIFDLISKKSKYETYNKMINALIDTDQLRFMYLVKEILDIESKMVYFCDKSSEIKMENISYEFEVKRDDNSCAVKTPCDE